jgi:hypothetical protein
MLAGKPQVPLGRLLGLPRRISRRLGTGLHRASGRMEPTGHANGRPDDCGPQTPSQHGVPPAGSTEDGYRPKPPATSHFYGTTRKLVAIMWFV